MARRHAQGFAGQGSACGGPRVCVKYVSIIAVIWSKCVLMSGKAKALEKWAQAYKTKIELKAVAYAIFTLCLD